MQTVPRREGSVCEEPWGGGHGSETCSWLVVWTRQTYRLRGKALERGQPPSTQQARSQVCLQTLKHPRVAIWTSGYPSIHPGGEAVLRRDGGVSGLSSSCGARGGFLPRHDEDLREPLVRRQGS